MIETLIYLLKQVGICMNYSERAKLIEIINFKLLNCAKLERGFLLCVRNPLKICILLVDLLNSLH